MSCTSPVPVPPVASSLQDGTPAILELESMTNGVALDDSILPAGPQAVASLGVSGDKPCGGEKAKLEATTGEELTAVEVTVAITTASSTAPPPAAKIKWSPEEADKYLQNLKINEEQVQNSVQITPVDASSSSMIATLERNRIAKYHNPPLGFPSSPTASGGGSPASKPRGGRVRGGGAGPMAAAPGAGGGGGGGGGGGNLQCYQLVQVPGQQVFYQHNTGPAMSGLQARQAPLSPMSEQVSNTNLYIRGLSKEYSDEDLVRLCKRFGTIISTKAILDKNTTLCRGYGFVDFENPADAQQAITTLQAEGVLAQFAKLPQQEQDPTNLYFSGLPRDYDEKMLENLVKQYGRIVSSRVIRNNSGSSKGVGFCRMENRDDCKKVIEVLDKAKLAGNAESITVKFADSGSSRRKLNRWKDFQEPYMYEAPPHLVTPNGVMGSRGLVAQGVLAPPYMTSAGQVHGYQVPPTGVSSTNWQSPTGTAAYYMQPANHGIPGGGQMDSVLTAQMGQLQISGTGYATPHQHPAAQYHMQYGGGWGMPHASALSHGGQEHSAAEHMHGGGSGDMKPHHIQVISSGSSEHSSRSDDPGPKAPVLYYPNPL